jgi:membrane protein implicated in regulation of membrane protease activity
MRMVWLGIAVASLLVAFVAHTPGLLAVSLFTLAVSSFAFVIGLVQSRIEDRSRPDDYLSSATELLGDRGKPVPRAPAAPRPAEPDDEP